MEVQGVMSVGDRNGGAGGVMGDRSGGAGEVMEIDIG